MAIVSALQIKRFFVYASRGFTLRCRIRILRQPFLSKLMVFPCFLVLLFVWGCGKDEVKQVSQESKTAQEAFKVADILRNAYMHNDRVALEENSTKDGYRELINAIKSFETVDLTFTPRWVEIQDSEVHLTLSWKGRWSVRGKSTEERGVAIFVLEGKPLKLAKVLRENPFRQPE
jgi:hypothetical protein